MCVLCYLRTKCARWARSDLNEMAYKTKNDLHFLSERAPAFAGFTSSHAVQQHFRARSGGYLEEVRLFFFLVSTCCFKTTSALTSFVTFSSVSGNRHLVPCNNWHAGSLCLWKVCFTGVMCGYPWRMMCLLYHCWNSSPDDRCYRTELAMTFLWQIYWWFPWLASLPLLIAHFQIAGDHKSILNA